jgi:hypothetical protein
MKAVSNFNLILFYLLFIMNVASLTTQYNICTTDPSLQIRQ